MLLVLSVTPLALAAKPLPMLQHILGASTPSGGTAVTLIDGNNLRGAEAFGISQRALGDLTVEWAQISQLPALLLLDHGPEERAWRVGSHAALTLCGEAQSADDVIVRDSWWLRKLGLNVFVVTNDRGLIDRCRKLRSPTAGSVQVLPSSAFARLLGCPESTDKSNLKETTAQRSLDAFELAAQLELSDANGNPDDDELVQRYVHYVNCEARPATRPVLDHTLDGAAAVTALQSKRSLRRKRKGKHLLSK